MQLDWKVRIPYQPELFAPFTTDYILTLKTAEDQKGGLGALIDQKVSGSESTAIVYSDLYVR